MVFQALPLHIFMSSPPTITCQMTNISTRLNFSVLRINQFYSSMHIWLVALTLEKKKWKQILKKSGCHHLRGAKLPQLWNILLTWAVILQNRILSTSKLCSHPEKYSKLKAYSSKTGKSPHLKMMHLAMVTHLCTCMYVCQGVWREVYFPVIYCNRW